MRKMIRYVHDTMIRLDVQIKRREVVQAKAYLYVAFSLLLLIIGCGESQPEIKDDMLPDDPIELNNRALQVFLNADGDTLQLQYAFQLWEKSVLLDSTNFISLTNKRMCAYALKDHRAQLRTSQQMLRLRPDSPIIMAMVGVDYENTGDKITAQKYYLQSLACTEVILDTMAVDHESRLEFETNLITMLILLDLNDSADTAIDMASANLSGSDTVFRPMLHKFKGVTQQQLLDPEFWKQ